jgi:hypothetical protein
MSRLNLFIMLPLFVLAIDLFTPYLITNDIIPAEIRWFSHVAIAIMIFLAILQMFVMNHIPRVVWIILAVTIVWSYVALGHGQGVPATFWGVWLLLQFLLVGLFAYLQPNPPTQLPVKIQKYALILLSVQVIFQLFQYASGEDIGDNLAGLFGNGGTGIALVFADMVYCLFLGYWIMSRRWVGLLASLVLGLISCTLGDVKVFPYTILIPGLVAIAIYAIKYHALGNALVILCFIAAAFLGFMILYNSIIPSAERLPVQAYLTDPAKLYEYLYSSRSGYDSGGERYSDLGRMSAVEVGWKSLQADPVTFLFGYGLGARSESRTWGTSGVALSSGAFGWSVGTSLLILMQELGLVGILLLACIILWIIISQAHDIRLLPHSPSNNLRFAIVLFSLLLPFMLWYNNIWGMRVPMFIYWYLIGYVLAESRVLPSRAQEPVFEIIGQKA